MEKSSLRKCKIYKVFFNYHHCCQGEYHHLKITGDCYYHHYQWLWNLHRWYLYPGHRSLQHTTIITISGCGIFIDGIFIPDIALCNILLSSLSVAVESSSMVSLSRTSLSATLEVVGFQFGAGTVHAIAKAFRAKPHDH